MVQKRVIVLLADGFEEVEALTVVDYLRRAKIDAQMWSIDKKIVAGSHKIEVKADQILTKELLADDYDAVIVPGGMKGVKNLIANSTVLELIKNANKNDKILGAICAGPLVLEQAGTLTGKKGTSYPGFEKELSFSEFLEDFVVYDQNIITSRGPATSLLFAIKLIEVLSGPEKAQEISDGALVTLFMQNCCRFGFDVDCCDDCDCCDCCETESASTSDQCSDCCKECVKTCCEKCDGVDDCEACLKSCIDDCCKECCNGDDDCIKACKISTDNCSKKCCL